MTALFSSATCIAACPAPAAPEHVALASVLDGDTIALADGRHVRLIGINAPEIGHGNRPAEPGGALAADFARRFLQGRAIGMRIGEDSRDRYDRTLAHVYDASGHSLEEALLHAGLARMVVIPPNVELADCLLAAEHEARAGALGLWGSGEFAPLPVARLHEGEGGFRLLRARVDTISRTRGSWWIELEERVSVQVARTDWHYFDPAALDALRGREIEVRGWLVWRDSNKNRARGHPPWMLRLGHPMLIQPL